MQPENRTWRIDARLATARLGAGLLAGLLCGFVIGGIGSRLAMFVLRVTSDPSLQGMETDDGFIIGRFSGDSAFLILFATALGVGGGLFYLLVRGWLPERARPAVMGALGATVGGAAIIRPDGIDFTLLEPLWLAIAMFVALPALYGVTMVFLTERWLRSAEERSRAGWLAILLPLMALGAGGPIGLILFVVLVAGWALNRRIPIAHLWRSPGVTWLGRAALLAVFGLTGTELMRDTIEVF